MLSWFTTLGARMLLLITLAMGLTLVGVVVVENNSLGAWKAGACGVVLALVMAAVGAQSVTRPMNRLTVQLCRTAGTGSITPDFQGSSRLPEVNRLAEALNDAARSIHHSQAELDRAYLEFVETMAQALDARDPYTAGHSIRVGAYAYAIASALSLPASQAATIRIAAQLHDIGKIGLPDQVLQKPGALTPEEFGLIKLHPQIGRRILEKVARFDKLLAVVELHHENHDGTGYPYKLSGHQIPLDARIVHVADAFDAMTTNRSYKDAVPLSLAIEDIRANSGSQFDPVIAEVFLKLIDGGKQAEMLLPTQRERWAAEQVYLDRTAVGV